MKSPLVILGATGVVGRGIVQAAVEAGRPVIAVARDAAELGRLQACHAGADITTLVGSVSTDADSAELAQALRGLRRPLAGVIVTIAGSGTRGRLLDQPVDALRQQFDEDLLPHLAAARHLLPLLAKAERGASYLLIGGPGSELPWAGYGHRSVASAAQHMLARVLHDEARTFAVRVQLLAVDMPVCSDDNRAHACPQWPSAVAIGRRALALLDQRDGNQTPRAVVRYGSPRSTAPTPPQRRADSPLTSSALEVGSLPAAEPVTPVAPITASPGNVLPGSCLLDARDLLRSLLPPNRNQETSS
ncbi:SDR family NAD(P)-dependent oxidoreductase [Montanilutibacter psychrotolerans]|uniref:SDR family oxidoreductase n=1 Tax=Montanilutibacter psychrotolerans TaxID=1327343 RepID=A0A3M8SQN8_9GAMM|nr:SDR family oxidoreductase [Lysobacter psychrotolerans]RNF83617.1 SDR family oxidoreductase [Lysobacter psychrotolerans]